MALLLLLILAQTDDTAPTMSNTAPAWVMKEFDALVAQKDWTGLAASIERAEKAFGARVAGNRTLRRAIRELVAALPADAQHILRASAEGRAKELLAREAFREIADTCALSTLAPAALATLARDAEERGDVAAAAGFWWRLLNEHPSHDNRSVTAVRLAHAWARLGRRHEIARLTVGGDVMVGDTRMDAAAFLATLANASDVSPRPDVVARAPDVRRAPSELAAESVLAPPVRIAMVLGGSTPAVAGDKLYLPLADRVVAIRMDGSLALVWTAVEGAPVTAATYLPLAAAVADYRVVATRYGSEPTPCVVRAYSRLTGEVLWEVKEETFKRALWGKSTVQLSPPAVADGLVCFGVVESATLNDIASAIALDLKTGAVRWVREIARATGSGAYAWRGAGRETIVAGAPPSAAVCDGRLFVATNLGVVAALDAGDGDLAWAATYKRTIVYSDKPPTDKDLRRMKDFGFPHAHAPPVFVDGKVFHLPLDGDAIVGFDRATGAAVPVPEVAPVVPSHLVASGGVLIAGGQTGACVIDVADAVMRPADVAPAGPLLRMAASGGQLHVVSGTRVPQLTRYDLHDEKILEASPLLAVEGDAALVMMGTRVVTTGATTAVYEPSPAYVKALAAVASGAPLSEDETAAYVAALIDAGDMKRAAELGVAASVPRARRDLALERAYERMHEARAPDERALWARRVVARAQTQEQRLEALNVLADALGARRQNEEAMEAAAIVLSETAGSVGPGTPYRSAARHEAWRITESDGAAREAYDLRASAARRDVKDDDSESLLRHAAAFPYSATGTAALLKAVGMIGRGADVRRVIAAIIEVGPTIGKDVSASLADALEKAMPDFPDDGEDYKRAEKLVALLRR